MKMLSFRRRIYRLAKSSSCRRQLPLENTLVLMMWLSWIWAKLSLWFIPLSCLSFAYTSFWRCSMINVRCSHRVRISISLNFTRERQHSSRHELKSLAAIIMPMPLVIVCTSADLFFIWVSIFWIAGTLLIMSKWLRLSIFWSRVAAYYC